MEHERWDCSEREAIDPPYLAPCGVMTAARTGAMIAVTGARTGAMTGVTGAKTAATGVPDPGCCDDSSEAKTRRDRMQQPRTRSSVCRATPPHGLVTW